MYNTYTHEDCLLVFLLNLHAWTAGGPVLLTHSEEIRVKWMCNSGWVDPNGNFISLFRFLLSFNRLSTLYMYLVIQEQDICSDNVKLISLCLKLCLYIDSENNILMWVKAVDVDKMSKIESISQLCYNISVSLWCVNMHVICCSASFDYMWLGFKAWQIHRHNLWIWTIQTPTQTAPPTLLLLTSRLYPSLPASFHRCGFVSQ